MNFRKAHWQLLPALILIASLVSAAMAAETNTKKPSLAERMQEWSKDKDYKRWLEERRVLKGSPSYSSLTNLTSEGGRFASMYQAPTESDKRIENQLQQAYIDYGPDSLLSIRLTWSVARKYFRDGKYDRALPHLNYLLRLRSNKTVSKEVDVENALRMVQKCNQVLNQGSSLTARSKEEIKILKLRIDYLMDKQNMPDVSYQGRKQIMSEVYELMRLRCNANDRIIRIKERQRDLETHLRTSNYIKDISPPRRNPSVTYSRDKHGIYTQVPKKVAKPVVPITKLSPRFKKYLEKKKSQ